MGYPEFIILLTNLSESEIQNVMGLLFCHLFVDENNGWKSTALVGISNKELDYMVCNFTFTFFSNLWSFLFGENGESSDSSLGVASRNSLCLRFILKFTFSKEYSKQYYWYSLQLVWTLLTDILHCLLISISCTSWIAIECHVRPQILQILLVEALPV